LATVLGHALDAVGSADLKPGENGMTRDTATTQREATVFRTRAARRPSGRSRPLPRAALLVLGLVVGTLAALPVAQAASGLSENFETGALGWTLTGFWHVTLHRSSSPSHSMWYGQETTLNYDNGAANSGTATSPSFTVGATNPSLTFQSWYQTEDQGTTWDQKIVQISTDGGASWTQLAQISDTPTQWNAESVGLGAYAGLTVKLRFLFDTKDSLNNNFEGWYVDDVVVTGDGGGAFEPPLTAGAATLFSDDFNDNLLSPSKWTILSAGKSVSETNQRLEMSVQEQSPGQTNAKVRSSSISAPFAAGQGVDASLHTARMVAGNGAWVAALSFRIERSDIPTNWVQIFYYPFENRVTLHDSAGNSQNLVNDQPIGWHTLRIAVTASQYTGYYDGTSLGQATTLFSGAVGVNVRLEDDTTGASAGLWETSGRDDVIVYAYGAAPVSPPTAPLNLMANAGPGAGQINLGWNAPASDGGSPVTGYKVYRAVANGGPYIEVASLGNVLSYTDSGLGNGVTRFYRVSAVNAGGTSPQSNTASATTFTTPSAPQNLQAIPGPMAGDITLVWGAPANPGGTAVASYTILRNGVGVATVAGGMTTYMDHNLALTGAFTYQVKASNLVGIGPGSNTVCARPFPVGPLVGC
jgi:immune inhibitor InhA-like protein/fibronectin type III domain protein